MDAKAYISSGILELYVAGLLSESENLEVYKLAEKHPEIKAEVVDIEAAILELSKSIKSNKTPSYATLLERMTSNTEDGVIPINNSRANWSGYVGWAASLIFAIGLFWMYLQNQDLQSELELAEQENVALEGQIADSKDNLEASENLLQTIRDKDIRVIKLDGQTVSPSAFVKVYWNTENKKILVDAQGLPEPKEGMVYQVWSLKLNPLTPTSIGILNDFQADDNKIFSLANPNESEAFGITLEPAGGSSSPNLEQLYTLGTVSSP